MSNKSLFNQLKLFRIDLNNKNSNNIDYNNIDYNITYNDNIKLSEKLKNFLQTDKEEDSYKNIYKYFVDYLVVNNLVLNNDKNIKVNDELKNLFNIDNNIKLTITNIGIYINKLLL